jgi:hypothetical protein
MDTPADRFGRKEERDPSENIPKTFFFGSNA